MWKLMETMRLRAIQHPSRVGELLDAFASNAVGLPERSRKVLDRSELPAVLQRVVLEATKREREWCAWTDEHRIWLFTAEMSLALSRERGTPVLDVSAYGEGGQLVGSGSWVADRRGEWHRCAD
jgi:hypothetical protein